MGPKTILIIAGEASGDLHGSNLVKSMKRQADGLRFWGIGGSRMAEAGVKLILSSTELSVVGLTEVFAKLRAIGRAVSRGPLRSEAVEAGSGHPHRLPRDSTCTSPARPGGKGSPSSITSVPRFGPGGEVRVRKVSRRVNRMAVILPFEASFYRDHGVEVEYVGHPLMDALPPGCRIWDRAFPETQRQRREIFVGLLPGSRKEEIARILPEMVRAAEILKERRGVSRFRLQLADGIGPDFLQGIMGQSSVDIQVFGGAIYDILGACDLVLATSGTVTLETAIAGVPMVIGYKLSAFHLQGGKGGREGPTHRPREPRGGRTRGAGTGAA